MHGCMSTNEAISPLPAVATAGVSDAVLDCMPRKGGCKAWLKLLFLLSSVVGLRAV